jgi:hypothetical protein
VQPEPPAGVLLWAFRQVEWLKRARRLVLWYIENRQVEYGDLGGGISDDTDLTNLWPGVALMGAEPDRVKLSLRRLLDAAYANGMFTRGLPTIQADELHSYEEGINALGQNLILDHGSPRQLERAMETARGVFGITGVNAAGHRHIRSSYYSGTKVAEDGVWGWARAYSYLVLQPAQLLVDYNGSPLARRTLVELADGLLAHRRRQADGRFDLPTAIRFATDEDGVATRGYFPWPLFWTAWRWTGERKYLDPVFDGGTTSLLSLNVNAIDQLAIRADWGPRFLAGEPGRDAETRPGERRRRPQRDANPTSGHVVWQLTGDKTALERLYASQIELAALQEYINTQGSLWTDRVYMPSAELQRARLGGVALLRNATFPGHAVSWRFEAPASDESVAILIPDATPTAFKVIGYNLETSAVRASLTGWDVEPGTWEMAQGIDADGDDVADQGISRGSVAFERSASVAMTFPPRATTVVTLKLRTPGVPYWRRPDLGIDREDVHVEAGVVRVRVHSLGAVPSSAATLVLVDRRGVVVASAAIPPLPAPDDLLPKSVEVLLRSPADFDLAGARVEILPAGSLPEISGRNNWVRL